jgi:acyl carrier protein
LKGGIPLNEQFIAGITKALQGLIPEKRLASLGEDSRLRDLGIDSVDMVLLITRLEDNFQISLSVDDLAPENFRDIASLIRLLEGKKAEVRSHDPSLSS